MPWDYPVLYFLGTIMDTDHIKDETASISNDLTALSELFLLPQVSDLIGKFYLKSQSTSIVS